MNEIELTNIKGGEISGTLLNAIARIFTVILDIGRSFGSALNYLKNNKTC